MPAALPARDERGLCERGGHRTGRDGKLRVQPHPQWFRTGDLGVLDGDQNLTYIDRVKDSLRRRGENISSVEVETAVMRHPAVLEAAVVGVPSELGEDDILLVVTLRPDSALSYPELLDFCSVRMPYFCVPRYVEVMNEIPKTIIGRVRNRFFVLSRYRAYAGTENATDTSSAGEIWRSADDFDVPAAVCP